MATTITRRRTARKKTVKVVLVDTKTALKHVRAAKKPLEQLEKMLTGGTRRVSVSGTKKKAAPKRRVGTARKRTTSRAR